MRVPLQGACQGNRTARACARTDPTFGERRRQKSRRRTPTRIDRLTRVAAAGAAVKQTKRMINCERIYPPLSRDPAAILAAAAPVTQAPPQRFVTG